MLQAKNIHKDFLFGDETIRVLNGIDIDIQEGDFLSIVGRSGSGKTTLLNVLSTLVRPDGGELLYKRKSIVHTDSAELNRLRQKEFAVIFQFHHLMPYMTVLQNVLLPYLSSLKPVPAEIRERGEKCLAQVGLDDKLHRLPGNLSGGEQQRVAIARAMVSSAEVLFADEPTGSLDKKTGGEIMSLLEELNDTGMTVIMVTHDPRYAERASRKIELSDGVIVDC
jgi:putative ABC transport system ATP-binding protein